MAGFRGDCAASLIDQIEKKLADARSHIALA
jgi:hypothetical protein